MNIKTRLFRRQRDERPASQGERAHQHSSGDESYSVRTGRASSDSRDNVRGTARWYNSPAWWDWARFFIFLIVGFLAGALVAYVVRGFQSWPVPQ
jgi:hypothetical protein